ncbi:hypothetical protein BX661DRAFT_177913 [Kickxella alabastrina]|uniref:uncharacterized protein n=1 Tax=Kickxella alabastrina TaxID=61397 RepID=UPI00221E6AB6|nr:uncharacterized protein BX661DRAFT_177913 [Kickxella alabastrina]KAI7833203.1 hypothetical protein BX661DRAFT_177913 [Kickxella alabastrina]
MATSAIVLLFLFLSHLYYFLLFVCQNPKRINYTHTLHPNVDHIYFAELVSHHNHYNHPDPESVRRGHHFHRLGHTGPRLGPFCRSHFCRFDIRGHLVDGIYPNTQEHADDEAEEEPVKKPTLGLCSSILFRESAAAVLLFFVARGENFLA